MGTHSILPVPSVSWRIIPPVPVPRLIYHTKPQLMPSLQQSLTNVCFDCFQVSTWFLKLPNRCFLRCTLVRRSVPAALSPRLWWFSASDTRWSVFFRHCRGVENRGIPTIRHTLRTYSTDTNYRLVLGSRPVLLVPRWLMLPNLRWLQPSIPRTDSLYFAGSHSSLLCRPDVDSFSKLGSLGGFSVVFLLFWNHRASDTTVTNFGRGGQYLVRMWPLNVLKKSGCLIDSIDTALWDIAAASSNQWTSIFLTQSIKQSYDLV